ncbi:MAG: hypothetical protein N2Z65_06515 [Clostridiales bacterium]|nr:hypothetical protein [Clostridiales bacterium]
MPNQYDSIANLLSNIPQGEKVLKNLDKLSAIMNSDEGKQFASIIKKEDTETIKGALSAAMDGNRESAKQMVASLLSSKEGVQVASKIAEILGE